MKKRNFKIFVLIILTTLYIGFIWFHSFLSGEKSSDESKTILEFLNNFINSLGIDFVFTELFIRKSAHFIEFAGLGVLVMWTSYLINRKALKNILQCSFICLATAVIDEFIQLYTPGRASAVSDVVLDYSGVLFGFILISLILGICRKFERR